MHGVLLAVEESHLKSVGVDEGVRRGIALQEREKEKGSGGALARPRFMRSS